jgi:hypothetical protein
MKDTWRAGLKSLEVERNVANLHHYAERSRHHTKDKQRLVVSVVAYDSLPGHHEPLRSLPPLSANVLEVPDNSELLVRPSPRTSADNQNICWYDCWYW